MEWREEAPMESAFSAARREHGDLVLFGEVKGSLQVADSRLYAD